MMMAEFGNFENLRSLGKEPNYLNPTTDVQLSESNAFTLGYQRKSSGAFERDWSAEIRNPTLPGNFEDFLLSGDLNISSQPLPDSDRTTSSSRLNQRDRLTGMAEYAPNQLIVKLKSGIQADELKALKTSLGASVLETIKLTGAQVWQIQGSSVEQAMGRYRNHPLFEYIEPNYRLSIAATPNDPSFGNLWGLNNTGQWGGTPGADIDALEAWNIQTGNPIVIGVIDTGVDYTHPDLIANIWTNPGEIPGDGIDNDGNGYIDDVYGYDFVNNDGDPMDDNGHGTHVAGTIAAEANNGIGLAGINGSAKIMPLKFLDASGSGFVSNAVKAIDYATLMGVKLTNNSWTGQDYSQALYDAISRANDAGSLFVAAAGNGGADNIGDDNDVTPIYGASYDLPNIISVAATDRYDRLTAFSNYGATSVDLAAPGELIFSTLPNNGYGYYSGTSMATPHVTGVLSLVMSQFPSLTHLQAKAQVLNNVDPLAPLAGKTVTGGRLNALKALSEVKIPAHVSINDVTLMEGDNGITHATFTVSLDAANPQTVSVNYTTADGTAIAGSDYFATSGTLSFAPGETSKTIAIPVIGDTLVEADETFFVNLTSATNGILVDSQGMGIIQNDDDPLDYAGNTLSNARAIAVSTTPTTYRDWIGSTDTNDYYKFTLSDRRTLNLTLNGLSDNANVQLLNSRGNLIVSLENPGTLEEALSRRLNAGTYYLRVYPGATNANTDYNLNLRLS